MRSGAFPLERPEITTGKISNGEAGLWKDQEEKSFNTVWLMGILEVQRYNNFKFLYISHSTYQYVYVTTTSNSIVPGLILEMLPPISPNTVNSKAQSVLKLVNLSRFPQPPIKSGTFSSFV